METHLAENAFANQLTKSFVPRKVCPSIFVTFVWDKSDDNPEYIFGVTMHCTKGIIIQIRSPITQQSNRPCQSARKTRNHYFSSRECKTAKYINCPRQSPSDNYADVSLEISEVDSGFKDSCKTNILRTLLRAIDKTIPDWTGFNYLINQSDDREQVHEIYYLPAINASPTENDTVLELLQQSKCKAEKLGLDETDIVLDQAIYAKATVILSNPVNSDLRKFIVLRLGAFHTTCIFLSTIGQAFANAGLKDWILESRILSMNRLFVICYFSNCENEVQQKEKNFPCVVNS